jgi:hypothetical protein
MVGALPVAWIAPEGARDAPSDEARRELAAWAKAHGVELAPLREEALPAPLDWTAVETVERELAHVRDALAGLEFDAAERALARAEAALRDHADLPQAAWLRAEVDRAWSARWLRAGDEVRAKRAWQRAAGLDRGREPGLGEKEFEPAAPITAVIRLLGRDAGDPRGDGARALLLDGALAPPGEVSRTEGEHALAIVDPAGGTLWAEWVTLAQGAIVRIEPPPPSPCSRRDLGRAHLGDGAVRAEAVRCGTWVAAVAEASGVVRVATCESSACTSLVEWRSITLGPPGWASAPIAPLRSKPEAHKWPAWATWTLVGIGLAGTAVAVAAAAGALKSSPQRETQFVSGGGIVEH